jgi:Zn-finger nucleic acid-binding protein
MRLWGVSMKCLVCKTVDLQEQNIVPGLKVHNCSECGGNWLKFLDYLEWHNGNDTALEISSEEKKYLAINDSQNPKLCPDCGRIMRVYKVASNLSFRIEHCNSCYGIWFDKNEWETLKENRLHNQIDKFFTDSWQNKLKEEERRDFFESHYARKFGDDYERLKSVREWINSSKEKSNMLAFLMDEDPYKL